MSVFLRSSELSFPPEFYRVVCNLMGYDSTTAGFHVTHVLGHNRVPLGLIAYD